LNFIETGRIVKSVKDKNVNARKTFGFKENTEKKYELFCGFEKHPYLCRAKKRKNDVSEHTAPYYYSSRSYSSTFGEEREVRLCVSFWNMFASKIKMTFLASPCCEKGFLLNYKIRYRIYVREIVCF
jgi:hypothetical protein